MMTYVTLSHANTKKPMYVAKELCFGVYFSDNHKCVHIVGPGNAIIPVAETLESVLELLSKGDPDNGQQQPTT